MVTPSEKPLTTRALNTFFQTVHAELETSGFSEHTMQDVLNEVAHRVLPVDDPLPGHGALGFVLAARTQAEDASRRHNPLPETLRELRTQADAAAVSVTFENEPHGEHAAQKRCRAILTKAYRAAEKALEIRSR